MTAMPRRHRAPLTIVTLLAVTATLLLRPAPTAAAPGNANPAAQLPEFAGIPATHTNLLLIDDVMPAIRAVVSSPRLLRPLDRFVAALGNDGVAESDLEGLVDWLQRTDDQRQAELNEIEAFIPRRMLLATDDGTVAVIGQAMEAAAVGAMAVAAGGLDAELADPYLDRLIALAEGFVTPRASLVLTMRDPATAMQMLGTIQMGAGFVAGQPGVALENQGNGIALIINVNDLVNGDANVIAQGLADMDLGDPESPKLQQLAAAIMKMTFRIAFDMQDSSFLISIGQPVGDGEPTLAADVLGDLWPRYTSPGTGLLFYRFNPTPLIDPVKGIEAAFDIKPDSPLGRHLAENPDFFGTGPADIFSAADARSFRLALEQMGTQIDFAVWLDSGLQLEGRAQNVPPVGELAPLNLPNRLPGELPLTFVTIGESVGVTLSTQLGSLVDLLESQVKMTALEEADWDEDKARPIAVARLQELEPLRTLLTERAEATFGAVSGGVAGVVETADKLAFTGGDLNDPETITLEQFPVPAGLLFVQLLEGQSGLDYLADLHTESLKLGEMLGELDIPPAAQTLPEADLGLGVRTLRVDLSWAKQAAAADGVMLNFELLGASADFHAFDFEGMLVLSTSPALSKRFIEAWNANGQPIEGQDALAEMIVPEVDGKLIGLARMEPSGLVFSLRQAADSIENVKVSDPGMLEEGGFGPAQAATAMRLVADLMEELALSEFVVFDKGQTRITRGAINLSRQLN